MEHPLCVDGETEITIVQSIKEGQSRQFYILFFIVSIGLLFKL